MYRPTALIFTSALLVGCGSFDGDSEPPDECPTEDCEGLGDPEPTPEPGAYVPDRLLTGPCVERTISDSDEISEVVNVYDGQERLKEKTWLDGQMVARSQTHTWVGNRLFVRHYDADGLGTKVEEFEYDDSERLLRYESANPDVCTIRDTYEYPDGEVRQTRDYDCDGVLDRLYVSDLNSEGNTVLERYDNGVDGVFDYTVASYSYSYKNGQVINMRVDYRDDGSVDEITSRTFDDTGVKSWDRVEILVDEEVYYFIDQEFDEFGNAVAKAAAFVSQPTPNATSFSYSCWGDQEVSPDGA